METRGHFAPATDAAVQEVYDSLARPAETVTTEIAEANTDTRADYRELTDTETVETAQQALFASLLEVQVGSTDAYEAWIDQHPDFEVEFAGTDPVPNRAWHPVSPRKTVVAVSFQDAPDAAVAAVRRQAFGRHYRSILEGE